MNQQQRMPQMMPTLGGGGAGFMKVLTAFVLGLSLGFLLTIQVVPGDSQVDGENAASQFVPVGPSDGQTVDTAPVTQSGGSGGSGTGGTSNSAGGSSGGGVNLGGGGTGTGGGLGGDKEGLSCQGDNGGKTDDGVTANSIKLASNMVTDGPGANFLSLSPTAMEAVKARVNASGGICGRNLELELVNDSWSASRGQTNIDNFIKQGYFALPVVPSSEGLSSAIEAGLIENAGIPVIGSDGMRQEQYNVGPGKGKASWVAPVAVATVSQVRIMADYAIKELGAGSFGIVYDKKYKFGKEGADAYSQYLGKAGVASNKIVSVGIEPNQGSYRNDANDFKGQCEDAGTDGKCDLVIFLLEPVTAQTWVDSAGEGGNGRLMTAGAQPLFNDKFARGCGSVCNDMLVWTGYNPAIGDTNLAKPDIARFVEDIRKIDPSADVTNQFAMGAYLGMEVFVHLAELCSPNLTRACIKAELDKLDYTSDFADTLSWRPNDHFANKGARAYAIKYQGDSFIGFEDVRTGFRRDPTPGVVPG